MARILYLLLSNGGLTGGQKMILRHVETLRELGFDAACIIGSRSTPPAGIRHNALILPPTRPAEDDVIVIGDDAADEAVRRAVAQPARCVVFAQSGYAPPAEGVMALDRQPVDRFPTFITVGRTTAARISRLYPQAQVEMIPCFADERLFRPGDKSPAITGTPGKRPFEARVIQDMFPRLHPRHAGLRWAFAAGQSEEDTARIFGASSLYLSLARLESVGLATLEAMASGCVCAGFLGGGGEQYGTAENGFWVPDEACEAATDALAEAADLVATGGPPLARMIEAGRATAEQWSYARFRERLEEVWMRLAPEARTLRAPMA